MKREYTDVEMRRWAKAIEDGVGEVAFRERFGRTADSARRIAARRGVELAAIGRATGVAPQAKAPPINVVHKFTILTQRRASKR